MASHSYKLLRQELSVKRLLPPLRPCPPLILRITSHILQETPLVPRLSSLLLASAAFALAPLTASAQRATAVPQLNLDKFTGTWYQLAKLPVKAEKKCLSDGTVLYALNDKNNSLQIGTFCTIKGGDQGNSNTSARMGKAHDGKLKIRRLILFSRPYWVLATDPDYTWALVGTPNHKSLWLLTRQVSPTSELKAQLQSIAAAQGFPVTKLVPVPHPKNRVTLASPSANPNQIETPSPTATKTPAQPSSTTDKP